jgi:hypothetical protein
MCTAPYSTLIPDGGYDLDDGLDQARGRSAIFSRSVS